MKTTETEKTFIAFLVIIALFFGYLISGNIVSFFSKYTHSTSSTYSFTNHNTTNSANPTNKEYIENPNNRVENITNKVALNISNQFKSKITEQDLKSSSTSAILDKLNFKNIKNVSDVTSNISPENIGIIYNIDTSSLNIVPDTIASHTKYWNDYSASVAPVIPEIQNNSVIEAGLKDITDGNDSSKINKIISDFQNTYISLSKINVPKSYIGFNSDNMVFFKNFASTMAGIADYRDDPLKAYVLTKYLPHLMDKWPEIENFMKKYAPKK